MQCVRLHIEVCNFENAVEQEAEIEEDVEATRVADWDKAAADAAYRIQVEQAQARHRLLEEERERQVCHVASLNLYFMVVGPYRSRR